MDPSISSKGSTAGAPEMLRPHGAALLLPPSSTPLPQQCLGLRFSAGGMFPYGECFAFCMMFLAHRNC